MESIISKNRLHFCIICGKREIHCCKTEQRLCIARWLSTQSDPYRPVVGTLPPAVMVQIFVENGDFYTPPALDATVSFPSVTECTLNISSISYCVSVSYKWIMTLSWYSRMYSSHLVTADMSWALMFTMYTELCHAMHKYPLPLQRISCTTHGIVEFNVPLNTL